MTMNNPPRRSKASAFRAHLLGCTAVLSVVQALSGAAWAQSSQTPGTLPTGGQVQSGVASIATTGTAMTVNQTTDKAIISWNQFNIGSGASVTFQQPGTGSMTLNRVRGGEKSMIDGALRATGTVILVNPSGVVFGGGSTVDVGGLIASTLDIADEDFEKGALSFTRGASDGSIVNLGRITARDGSIALLAPQITNLGYIRAELGAVVLAAGETVTLRPDGGVPLKVDASLVRAEIEAGGIIQSGGGSVYLSAQALNRINAGVIKATGVIEADSLTDKGGTLVLDASGPITLEGALFSAKGAKGGGTVLAGDARTSAVTMDARSRIDASATDSGKGGTVIVNSQDTAVHGVLLARGGRLWGDGGFVETSGHELAFDGIKVDVGAVAGKGGNWLLDPYDLTVNAAYATAIQSALASGNVTLQTTDTAVNVTGVAAGGTTNASGNGDIFVNSGITWTSANSLTLDAWRGVTVNAGISGTSLSILTNNGGTGGRFAANAAVDLSTGLNINGTSYTMVTSGAQLTSMGASGTYALGRNVTLGYSDLGMPFAFNGTLEGLGHTVSGLTTDLIGVSNAGLFSTIGSTGSIANLGIVGARVTAGASANGTAVSDIGLLAGQSSGTIFNSYATGTLSITSATSNVGGLVGVQSGGTILSSWSGVTIAGGSGLTQVGGLAGSLSDGGSIGKSHAIGNVTVGSAGEAVGGLVGWLGSGTVSGSSASGTVRAGDGSVKLGGLVGQQIASGTLITQSYADGGVLAGNSVSRVGGLVGEGGAISAAYALGTVSVGNGATAVGGLVGYSGGAISGAYATGTVISTSGTAIGGFIGENTSSIAASFYDTATSGLSVDVGTVNGGTDAATPIGANTTLSATYAGFDFTTDWFMVDGRTRPFLRSEYSTIITNAHQLQLVSMDVTADYLLGANIDLGRVTLQSDMWSTAGFTPIGFSTVSVNNSPAVFTGSLDGRGFTISNLTLNPVGYNNVGLFSSIGSTGSVANLTLSNGRMITGFPGTVTNGWGLLAGKSSGTVSNVTASGTINATRASTVGGLIGGLVGGTILNSSTGVNITAGTQVTALGGLAGFTTGTSRISDSFATGNISVGNQTQRVGVLVGDSINLSLVNSYATGNINGSGSGVQYVGGLVGLNNSGTVSDSYATGNITLGSASQRIGGLVGYSTGLISNTYATGNISLGGTNNQYIGGLVGLLAQPTSGATSARVVASHATGNLTLGNSSAVGTAGIYVGGLVGLMQNAVVSSSYATGNVLMGRTSTYVGGLVGSIEAFNLTMSSVLGSYASGTISIGSVATDIGGLVGRSNGGLISGAYANGTITASSAGTITGNGVGGLVGNHTVSGSFPSTLLQAWSSVAINVPSTVSAGGAIGRMLAGTVSSAYWDVGVSGRSVGYGTSTGGSYSAAGISGAGAYAVASYGNLDFTNTWYMIDGSTRPFLQAENQSTIINAHQLQMIGFNPGGNYVLGANITLAGLTGPSSLWASGYVPLALSGTLDGRGHTISGLTLSSTSSGSLGLFSTIGSTGSVANLTLTGGSVTGGGDFLGLLAGLNQGRVSAVATNGGVTALGSAGYAGGMVGLNTGTIDSSYATGTVSAGSAAQMVGGLSGRNDGIVTNSYASATVRAGSGAQDIGGLVGRNAGTIANAYALGAVSVTGSGTNVAGFAGNNLGTIANAYATGSVVAGGGSTNVGGLAGASSGVISGAYWDRTTTGQTVGVGADSGSTTNVTGFTNGAAYSSATYASFDFSSNWYLLEGLTRPILRAEHSTTIGNAHQLQLVTLDLSGTYVLGGNIDMAELSSASGIWKTASGFVPIGATSASVSSAFTGTFNGQGYAINNLSSRIDTLSNPAGGLFAQIGSGAVVQNLGVYNATVTNMGSGGTAIGVLAGINAGAVSNVYATGVLTVGDGWENVGGLIGANSGSITNAYSTVAVTVGTGASHAIGGLAGYNAGWISAVYASGPVTVGAGGTSVGGLVGEHTGGSILSAYWDSNSSSQTVALGSGTATTTDVSGTAAYASSTYTGLDLIGPWYMVDGYTRPFLRMEYSKTISNAHQLQLISLDPSAQYDIVANITMNELTRTGSLWSSMGWVPIGFNTAGSNLSPTAFTGIVNGGGYVVSGMTISNGASNNLGLFSLIGPGGQVSNLTLSNARVTTSTGVSQVGLFAGQNQGTVNNVFVSGALDLAGTAVSSGGLIGLNTGRINNSAAHVTVQVSGRGQFIGGLVGQNSVGSIYGGYATGSITSGDGSFRIGGLVGTHVAGGLINNAYSTVDLSIGTSADSIGGLVGFNTNSTISGSYAANSISVGAGSSGVSGLVGSGSGTAIITDSFWDVTKSGLTVGSTGISTSGTVAGLSTAEWFSNGPLAQSVFSSDVWVQGYPYPVLKALPYITLTGSGTGTYGQTAASVSIVSAVDQNGHSITSGLSTAGLTWAPAAASASVGTAIIGGSGASYSGGLYQFAYNGTLTIAPAALTISASGVTKTYGNAVNVTGYTTSGLVTGDSIDTVTLLPSGGTSAGAAPGTYTISASGATGTGLSNYSITYVNGALVVDPAALTITASNVTKTYGNAVSVTGYTSSGLVNGDTLTGVTLLASGGTGTAANAGSYTISASGATGTGLSNYSITYANGTLVVDPASLTITASGATKTYGNSINLTGFTSNGLINGDSISAVSLTSTGAGTTATVGSYTISGSGATGTGLSNYSITYANGTLVVDPASLTITASGTTKTYGTSAGLTGFTSSGLVNGDTVTAVSLTSGGADTAATVGSYDIVGSNATGSGLSNYSITYANGTLVVDPAALTITPSGTTKTYGTSAGLTGFTSSGLVNGDTVTAVTLTSGGADTAATVGSYTISASGATGTGLSNYSITYASGTLVVAPASLTVTASGATKTYGNSINLTGFTSNGLINGDSISAVSLTSTGAGTAANAGSYTISGSGATGTGLSNYSITYANGTLVVNPAALTITPSGATKTYGTSAGLTGFTSSGLINGDTVTAVTLTSGGADTAANVGSYSIVGSNATGSGLSNYSITYANGTLVVNPAALTITPSGATKTYGTSAGLTGFTSSGLVNGDTVTAVTLTSGGADTAATVGSYDIVGSNATGTGLSNYSVTYASGTLVVNPAALIITASDAVKSYGSTISLTGYSANGLVNGDSISAVILASDGSPANASIGHYAIQATGATGIGLSNYSITYAAGTLTVGKAILTVKATDVAKIYGSIGSLSGFTISGLLDGDNVSTVTLSSDGLAGTAAVGSYAINASNVSGSGLDNYAIAYVGGTLTVTPAPLTITGGSGTKTYGSAATLTGFSVAGLVNGDSVGAVTLSSLGADAQAAVGSYGVSASGATGTGLSNYAITYVDGTLGVNPAALTITAGNAAKTYGTDIGLTGFSAAGLVNGDSIGGVALSSAGTGTAATVGSYAVTASGATGTGLSNYAITYVDGTLVVNPAALTISAGNASKVAGSDLSLTAFSAAGLVNGDAVSSVTLSSPGTPASAVAGTYAIVASNAAGTGLGNYTIRYQDGQLTVTPAASPLTTGVVQRIVVAAVVTPAVTIAATSTPATVSTASTAGTPAATSSASSSTASSTTGSSSSSSSGTATENGGGNGGGASATTAETGTASGTTGGGSANGEALPILVGGGDGGEDIYSQIQMTSNPIKGKDSDGKESDERQQ
ncbi:MBG domain-containing protein [Rhodospirillum centenum]|uniref:The GLUG motif domain protein, putative n=1 Tax=Rhodospirillum centenum (strain ATCC 51521 / SW) TaxID=414684 RepID=B6ISD4_RHOCS|nr:MBG domain-containing protein [Rhodospirillum centenum]ACI98370.1 the GLUG motif domain protein, putative [Rhodospirillum centenum SW]